MRTLVDYLANITIQYLPDSLQACTSLFLAVAVLVLVSYTNPRRLQARQQQEGAHTTRRRAIGGHSRPRDGSIGQTVQIPSAGGERVRKPSRVVYGASRRPGQRPGGKLVPCGHMKPASLNAAFRSAFYVS
jgi:hypothetical protein